MMAEIQSSEGEEVNGIKSNHYFDMCAINKAITYKNIDVTLLTCSTALNFQMNRVSNEWVPMVPSPGGKADRA
jgi:hypothetical protein